MPLVTVIAGKTRDRAIELTREAEAEDAIDYVQGVRDGYFEALRTFYKSETIGMLIMDCDAALEGDELFTNCLPRLVLKESS